MPAISLENLTRFKTKLLTKIESMFIKAETKGVANGVASLDSSGKVPSTQLPSYVDDVLEYLTVSDFPETGEQGKIYVATTTSVAYRWAPGTGYVGITSSLQLGTGHGDAYYGDYGNTAYTHATDSDRNTSAVTSGLYKIAATAEGHVASLTAVTKSDITGLGIPSENTTYDVAAPRTNGLMSGTDKTKLDKLANAAIFAAKCETAGNVERKLAECSETLPNKDTTVGRLIFVYFDETNTVNPSRLKMAVKFGSVSTETLPIMCQYKNELAVLPSADYLIGGHAYLFGMYDECFVLLTAGSSYGLASQDEAGLMTAEDKAKLDSPVFEKLYYGTCMTEMEVKDKKVLCPDLKADNLVAGVIVFVYFQNGNSASEDTLTMEVGSTGVKPLKCLLRGQISKLPYPDYLLGYQTYMFQYDGTNWVLMNTDTNDDASFAIDESTGELMVTIY